MNLSLLQVENASPTTAKNTSVKKRAVRVLTFGSSYRRFRWFSIVSSVRAQKIETHNLHHLLYVIAQPPEHQTDNGLNRHDPRFPSSEFRREDRVDDWRPEEFERVGIGTEGEDSDLRVRQFRSEEERDRSECESDRDTL